MISTLQDRARLAGGADNRWEVTTRLFQDKLNTLLTELDLAATTTKTLEVRHFFNGAALYADKVMCVSWSPVGLAFKLPADEVETLIENRLAIALKYFAKGHVKKGYALFENADGKSTAELLQLFERAIEQAGVNA